MMLWLLATLSVVTISWAIAHRLKAVNPRPIAQPSGARVAPTTAPDVRTAACTDTERRSANPRTGHCSLRTQNFDTTHIKENNA